MAGHSKLDPFRNVWVLLAATTFNFAARNVISRANYVIVMKHFGRSSPKALNFISKVSSGVALLEFLVNPFLGNSLDKHGRKLFLGIGCLSSVISRMAFLFFPTIQTYALERVVNDIAYHAFYLAMRASIGDMFKQNPEMYSHVNGKLHSLLGIAPIFTSMIGGYLTEYDIRSPYLLAVIMSAISTFLICFFYQETLNSRIQLERQKHAPKRQKRAPKQRQQSPKRQKHPQKGQSTKRQHFNPFSFTQLFQKSSTFSKMNLVLVLQMAPLYMMDVLEFVLKEVVKWGPRQRSKYYSTFSLIRVLAGIVTGPIISLIGTRQHAIWTTFLTALLSLFYCFKLTPLRMYILALANIPTLTRYTSVRAELALLAQQVGYGQGRLNADGASCLSLVKMMTSILYAKAFEKDYRFPFLLAVVTQVCAFALLLSTKKWKK